MSADAWGIEDGYIDTGGAWRPTGAEARARLRASMGGEDTAPPPHTGPLVHRAGHPRPPLEGAFEIALEDGATLRVDGGLPDDLPLGYHEVRPLDGRPARPLIVAPARCHLPEALRTWGWALQLYALRSGGSWGMGDLADLRRLAEWSRDALGAGAI
ncbi:MAG: 4-alpha-glucanotransferase, partial [Candidatus Rokuibacteriota bacterium]